MANTLGEEDFISLVMLAKQDEGFKQQLLQLLRVSEPERYLYLNELRQNSVANNAPQEFLRLLNYLSDDQIARQLIKVLHD